MSLIYIVGNDETYALDVTSSFTVTYAGEVTQYPVESGFDVTKGVIDKSDTMSISGIISDTHIYDSYINRSNEILRGLKTLKESRSTVTVVLKGEVYSSMVITAVNATEDVSGGNAKSVDLSLTQVRVAASSNTTVPREAKLPDLGDLSGDDKNVGAKSKSWYADLEDGALGLLSDGVKNVQIVFTGNQ